jgi:hypothetical protein
MAQGNRTHFYASEVNKNWLNSMESKGVSKSSLINLALSILIPRTGNVGTTDARIKTVLAESQIKEALLTEKESKF